MKQIEPFLRPQLSSFFRVPLSVLPQVRDHIEGIVRLRATIDKDGSVKDLRLVTRPRDLVQAAMNSTKQWKYEPVLVDGKAAEVLTVIDVISQLNRAN